MIRTEPQSFIPIIKENRGFQNKPKSEQDKIIENLNGQNKMQPLNCPTGF